MTFTHAFIQHILSDCCSVPGPRNAGPPAQPRTGQKLRAGANGGLRRAGRLLSAGGTTGASEEESFEGPPRDEYNFDEGRKAPQLEGSAEQRPGVPHGSTGRTER